MSQLKNLKEIADTLRAYAKWFEDYRAWWKSKYGHLSDQEISTLTNGSSPPPPPPKVPPE